MKLFTPERVFFEPAAFAYPLGMELRDRFLNEGIEVREVSLQNVTRAIPGNSEQEKYARSKKTLVVGVKKSLKFDVCKPSADYEFSLVTNCPGSCEYCYLQTTQGYKPYLRAYVNLDEIFQSIEKHIAKNPGSITTFEAASAGDPLSLEHITGSLAKTIEFFGNLPNGRLRVVTKFDQVSSLLDLHHHGHTRFRFSINARSVIQNYEHITAGFDERIRAASMICSAGYPLGFIVAPIMLFDGWKEEYEELFHRLREQMSLNRSRETLTFELIQHRFTPVAKKFIQARFPNTRLDMDEEKRMPKWGKFGHVKYVYPREQALELKETISGMIIENFPESEIVYFT